MFDSLYIYTNVCILYVSLAYYEIFYINVSVLAKQNLTIYVQSFKCIVLVK